MLSILYTIKKSILYTIVHFISLTDYLRTHTLGGMTFHQYTEEYVCREIQPGQELTFGTLLLGDEMLARQVIGVKRGNDSICEQLQGVVSEWLRQSPRTWDQFLVALEKHAEYNHFRRHTVETLKKMGLGI